MFKVAAEITDHVSMIFVHTQYGKGSKKPENKGRNPYYIPYHRADLVIGYSDPISMELSKATLKC